MKRKHRFSIFTIIFTVFCTFVFSGCLATDSSDSSSMDNSSFSESSSDTTITTEIEQIYTEYVSYVMAQGKEPLSYEEWLATIKGEKGDTGEAGKSAYQIWLEAGNEGTELDFLNWLKGEKGEDGSDGANGSDGEDGSDGKSAYQIWLEAGNEGTEADFLNWLKGEKGEDGSDGANGSDGEDGSDGKSAYQIWLEAGNEGSELDFLNWLKGEKGEDGSDGANGSDGEDGEKGDDGRGILKTEIIDGYLWITYTDAPDEPVNLGKIQDVCAHTWTEWVVFHTPTCHSQGYRARECGICGGIEADIMDMVGHSFTNYIADNNVTCETDGTETAKCDYQCGETHTKTIIGSALGHNYVTQETKQASCTEDGYILLGCDRENCDSEKRQVVSAHGHNFGGDNVCDVCGFTVQNHEHNCVESVKEPTCTESGYSEYTCACGYMYRDNFMEPQGHLYDDGTIILEATCTDNGEMKYTCTRDNCQESYTCAIPASHDWTETIIIEKTCTTDGSKLKSCNVCGAEETEVIPASHDWDEGTFIKEPNCVEKGTKTCVCLSCNAEETFEVAELGHTFVDGVCTRCGATIPDAIDPDVDFLKYGMYFDLEEIVSNYGPAVINKYGVYLDYNSSATINKVGVYLTQVGTNWRRCIACTGENIEYANYVPFLSYDDELKYSGLTSNSIAVYPLGENADNIWCYSNYATIWANLADSQGNLLLSIYDIGQAGTKTRVFDDLNEMISWLKEDSSCINHEYTTYVGVHQEATCTTNRVDVYQCAHCTITTKVEVENSTVACSFTNYVPNNDATCLQDGTETALCDYGCGKDDVRVIEGSAEHKYTQYVGVFQEATCTTNRIDVFQCAYCTLTKNMEIEGTAQHDYSSDWLYDEEKHWRQCTVADCGHIAYEQGHNWDSGVLSTGGNKITYTCTDCEQIKKEFIGPRTTITHEEWLSAMEMTNYTVSFSNPESRVSLLESQGDAVQMSTSSYYGNGGYEYFIREDGQWYSVMQYGSYAYEYLGYPDSYVTDEALTLKWIFFYEFEYEYVYYMMTYDEDLGAYYLEGYYDSSVPVYYAPYTFYFKDGVLDRVVNHTNTNEMSISNIGTTSFTVPEFHVHVFDQQVESDYFRVNWDYNCQVRGEYYYSCVCGEYDYTLSETFIGGFGEHNYGSNGLCTVCGVKKVTQGLQYKLSADKTYYSLSGMGNCWDSDIYVPAVYKDLPVKEILHSAFDDEYISKLDVPASVTNIEEGVFRNCRGLQEIQVDPNNTVYQSIGGHLYTKDGKTLIQYAFANTGTSFTTPEGVTHIHSFAFNNSTKLKNLVFSEGVTHIDYSAFQGCTNLETISLPNSIVEINGSDISNCSKLQYTTYENGNYLGNSSNPYLCLVKATSEDITTATVHKDCKIILTFAFHNCTSLSEVTFEDGIQLKKIYGVTFYGSGITEIVIPEGVEVIDYEAFSFCNNLTRIVIPDSVTRIDDYAFMSCTALSSIEVGQNNTVYQSIDGNLYTKDGKTLIQYAVGKTDTTFTTPNGVTHIKENAVSNCQFLESVVFSDGVTHIMSSAFSNCVNLTSVSIPDSIVEIDGYAFYGCDKLQYTTYNNAQYLGNSTNLYLYLAKATAEDITTVTVHKDCQIIFDFAFENCTSLVEVTFEEDSQLTQIGSYAFKGTGIQQLILPNGLETIGTNAFENCTQLTSVEIPDSVASIGDGAFDGCLALTNIQVGEENLAHQSINGSLYTKDGKTLIQYAIGKTDTTFTVPDGVTSIYKFAFRHAGYLEKVIIADSVTSIGNLSFADCTKLKSVEFTENSGLLTIDSYAFSGCTALTSIAIPDSLKELATGAFEGCTTLSAVLFGENIALKSIGWSAFEACSKLTTIAIPDSVESIGIEAFLNCSSLESVTFGKDSQLREIGSSAFENCTSLKNISIPDGVTAIYYGTFNNCERLSSVMFGENSCLETIARWSFYNCNFLLYIVIPRTVISIGDSAFEYTGLNLRNVYYHGTIEDWNMIDIDYTNNNYFLSGPRFYYVENAEDVPNDGGNYWHYDENGSPKVW